MRPFFLSMLAMTLEMFSAIMVGGIQSMESRRDAMVMEPGPSASAPCAQVPWNTFTRSTRCFMMAKFFSSRYLGQQSGANSPTMYP